MELGGLDALLPERFVVSGWQTGFAYLAYTAFGSFPLRILQYSMDCVTAPSSLDSKSGGAERQMRVPSGRTEKRSAWTGRVELSRPDLLLPVEITVAENISPRGVRVASKQRWKEGNRVLIKAPKGDPQWQMQVVYCEILPSNTFAIGLKRLTAGGQREKGTNGRARGDNGSTQKRRSRFQAPIIRFPRVRG